MKTEQLIENRQSQYNDAWLYTGSVMQTFNDVLHQSNLFTRSPFAHNWVLILSKLFRALHSPYNVDHWQDIMGYCKLIVDYIDERNGE